MVLWHVITFWSQYIDLLHQLFSTSFFFDQRVTGYRFSRCHVCCYLSRKSVLFLFPIAHCLQLKSGSQSGDGPILDQSRMNNCVRSRRILSLPASSPTISSMKFLLASLVDLHLHWLPSGSSSLAEISWEQAEDKAMQRRWKRPTPCHAGDHDGGNSTDGTRTRGGAASRRVPESGHGMAAESADLAAAWPREGVGVAAALSALRRAASREHRWWFVSFPSTIGVEAGR
jgi:hypothetical protein